MLMGVALGAPPSDAVTATVFASDIGASMTVFGTGRGVSSATPAASYDSARVNTAIPAAGKYAWRIVVGRGVATANAVYAGVGTAAVALNTYLGSTAAGWAYGSDGSAAVKINNNVSPSFGSAFSAGSTLEIAIDMGAGAIWFGLNGVWQGSGDPAAGTNAAYTGLSGTLYPMVSMGANSNVYFDPSVTPPTGFSRLP